MAATIPSLWPEDIRVDILPPVTILRAQASKLGELTQGILEAEVTTVTGEKNFVMHRLDLIAPALEDRRVRILTATHREDFYPIVLDAECFTPPNLPAPTSRDVALQNVVSVTGGSRLTPPAREWPHPDDWRPVAANQDEFLQRVGEVLRSKEVRAVIDSMIARSNLKTSNLESDDSGADDGEEGRNEG